MWNDENNLQYDMREKVDELLKLNQRIEKQESENESVKRELQKYRREFRTAQEKIKFISSLIKKVINFPRSLAAYTLGRRNLKQLYSQTYKSKNAANTLKPYKYRLYDLGFIQKSLDDLEYLLTNTKDRYLRRAIAWELALWHANKYTEDDAFECLYYLDIASNNEKDIEQQRKIAILQAESYELIQDIERGKEIIEEILAVHKHPDLYFAAANLEESIDKRIEWINKALASFNIHPITFAKGETNVTYDQLRTTPIAKKVSDGPKVSIILPAYNYASGIQIAIESLLTQTWQNIELLIVDDCSTDNTVAIVKEYMAKDSRIKLLSTPVNSGPYVARNIGLKEATGEYVTINDADDWSHAEKIEVQVNHLINNPEIIANTSEHARLTEDLKFYRRGTPGYIFSNMSSLMFRRKLVLERVGYWDSVRFAADGEFKRRLIKVFGKQNVVDLKTGPLSLPRQSRNSLTGNSAFGYNGFFMGARKEYVESFEHYHRQANTLYYSFPQQERPFPVPEPMWPKREETMNGVRHFDIVIAADFRIQQDSLQSTIQEIKTHKKRGLRTGLMQLSCYNMGSKKGLQKEIREIIDGHDVQMLVYGEEISCDVLIIKNLGALQEKQKYLPNIQPKMIVIIVDQLPMIDNQQQIYHFRDCARHIRHYFGKQGKWFAYNNDLYKTLLNNYKRELRFIKLSQEIWMDQDTSNEKLYTKRLDEWLIETNPYLI